MLTNTIKVGPFLVRGRLNGIHPNLFRVDYVGKDPAMKQKLYVMKIRNPNPPGGPEEHVETITHEATILANPRLRAIPTAAKIVHFGDLDGAPYFITEFVEGTVPVPGCNVTRMIDGVSGALRILHSMGYAHCDLKPANVILRPSGYPVLIDFGIAQKFGPIAMDDDSMILGTYGYMAPEVASCSGVYAKSDVFSLAAIVHEMRTGYPFYAGIPESARLAAHVNGDPVAHHTHGAKDLPPKLLELLRAATSKNPSDRISLDQFQAALPACDVAIDPLHPSS